MTITRFLKSSGLAALAVAIAIPSLSATATAQERPQRGEWRGGGDSENREARRQERSG